MASSLAAGDGRRRFLIATGVTAGLSPSGARAIAESLDAVVGLAVGVFGYERVTSLGLNPTADQLRRTIHSFCAERDPDDVVLIYHTGHADLTTEREHRLWMGDTRTGSPAELMRTRDIAEMALSGTRLGNLLVMLDTCYAARGSADVAMASLEWQERDERRMFVAMSAAHPLEQIQPGQFTKLLTRAVHHQASGGTEPQYLHAGVLAHHMMADPQRPLEQTISSTKIFDSSSRENFFPNPRYDPTISGRDEHFKSQQEQADKRRREIHDHFAPRGRGVESAAEQAWRFVGRHTALRNIAAWLNGEDRDPRSRIVTGRPGSGKSALLGRLVLLSDKELRGSVPLTKVPSDTIPQRGTIDVAVHARGKTTTEVREALAAALGARERCDSVGDLLRALHNRTLCAVVDAVDEAVDQHDLVRTLLRPLIDDGPESGLRLLIGTRAHLLDELGPGAVVLDLDTPGYSDRESIVAYSERNLRETHADSPYRGADPDLVHAVAEAVAERANLSFLVAMIVSRTLATAPAIPDPTDQDWRQSLPSTAAQAMAHDLDTRLRPEDAVKVRHLLTPLAFAYGAGLPWEDIWVPLANSISGIHYTDADVLWLRRTAGSYLVETLEAERSAYRLYHEALAEHVRENVPAEKVHAAILEFFLDYCDTPRGREWQDTHQYALTHLSIHAAAAGRLDDLTDDPRFLIEAEQSNLLAAFGAARTSSAAKTAAVYQLASHHLRDKPPGERASYLELTAHRVGATEFAAKLRPLTAAHTWSTKWARWKVENPHRVLHAHNGWVTGLARLPARGAYRGMVVSCADDRTIRVWDVRKGIADGLPMIGHDGQVLAIEVVDLPEHGQLLLVSAGGDHTVRVWDVPSRRQRGNPLTGHQDKVHLVTAARHSNGRPLVFSADRSGQLRVWDLLDHRAIEHPLNMSLGKVSSLATFIQPDGTHLLVVLKEENGDSSRQKAGRIQVFDVSTGAQISELLVASAVRGVHQATPSTLIIVTDTSILECDLGGTIQRTIDHHHTARVSWSSCASTPQGTPLAITTSTDGTIRTFDLEQAGPVGPPLSGSHRHATSAIHLFLDDAQVMVVSGNNDGTVRLWDGDVDRDSQPASNQPAGQIRAIVVDDPATAFYTAGDHHIRQWRLQDGLEERTVGPTGAPIVTMAGAPTLSPSPLVVTDKQGGTYRVDYLYPDIHFQAVDRGEVPTALVHLGRSNKGKALTASAYESGVIRVREIGLPSAFASGHRNTGPRTITAQLTVPHAVTCMALFDSENPQLLIGASDGSIRRWSHRTKNPILLPTGHTDVVTAMTVHSHLLVSAGDDHKLILWDLSTHTRVLDLPNQHTHHIHALAWIPPWRDKSMLLISGGAEGLLRCWNVQGVYNSAPTLFKALTIDLGAPIYAVAAGPGRCAIVGTDHGIAVISLPGL